MAIIKSMVESTADWPRIIIAGCGPGHQDYLTASVHNAVANAEVLVGASHLLELFPPEQLASTTRIPVGSDIPALLDMLETFRRRRIVVLVSGDTGLFSLARSVQKRFGRKHCQLIPGISSIQVACARLGLDWNDLRIISAHGRTPTVEINELRHWDKIAILAGTRQATIVAAELLEQLGTDYCAITCENLTLKNEQIRQIQGNALRNTDMASRTIVMLINKELLQ